MVWWIYLRTRTVVHQGNFIYYRKIKMKYGFEVNAGDYDYTRSEGKTPIEAAKEGFAYHDDDRTEIKVCVAEPISPSELISSNSASGLLEYVTESLSGDFGYFCEDYLSTVSQEAVDDLTIQMQAMFSAWSARWNQGTGGMFHPGKVHNFRCERDAEGEVVNLREVR